MVKTSLVLHGLGDPDQHEAWLRKLVYPKQAARAALHVSGALRSFSPDAVGDDAALRRFLHGLGRPHITAFFDAWAAWRPGEQARRLRERALRIASRGDALTAGELAVNGHDVKSIWPGITGPEVGVVLNRLLDHVLTHPGDNTQGALGGAAAPVAGAGGRRLRSGGRGSIVQLLYLGLQSFVDDVGVTLRRRDGLVPEKFLNRA